MKKILVSGSLAYDHLYTFSGVFQRQILQNDKGPLSVAFNVGNKAVHFGGCAGNIVFNGKLLKEDFILLGIAGKDFTEYEDWLVKNKIDTQYVIHEPSLYTSLATVVTDSKGQQITLFHPGAASKSSLHKEQIIKTITKLAPDLAFALISPNDRDFMLASIEGCDLNKISFFFDPGQAMPVFTKNELREILKKASGVFLNEYEFDLIQKLSELSKDEIISLCQFIVVTLGERGSVIYWNGEEIEIPAVKPKVIKDPTGCGDAYRSGFLIGILKDYPHLDSKALRKAGEIGTALATACLQVVGTQNHKL